MAAAVDSREAAVIRRGRGRVVDDEQELIRENQDHVDKYQLKIDSQARTPFSRRSYVASRDCA